MKISFRRHLIAYLLAGGMLLSGCKASEPGAVKPPVPNDLVYGPGWSAAHADGKNSDYSPVQGPRKVKLSWQRKFEGTINLGPTSDKKGRVYITTNDGDCHLYVLDPETGRTIWCTDKVNKFAVASSALLDRDGNFFIADDQAMHAFDESGDLIWETPIKGFPLSAQFTHTGRLIFITHIGIIYVLDRQTGTPVLEPLSLSGEDSTGSAFDPRACLRGTADCPCANTLAFDQQSGSFFFTYWKPGADQSGLVAMQYSETGKPLLRTLWENTSLPGGSASSPDISADGTRIYVNDNHGDLHAIDAATGRSIWRFEIGYEPGGSQSTSPEGLIIPAGGNGAALMCLRDLGDRAELLWRNDSLQNRGVATQAAGNVSYVSLTRAGSKTQHDLIVVDTRTGQVLDSEQLPGKTLFTVGTTIGPEGNVYVPTFNGILFAYRPD